jgi:hypothetical protein
MRSTKAEAVVVGGGLGGVAAALALTDMGARTILVAHDEWLGGQATTQAVPPDEHPWIESLGYTRRYGELRFRVRDHYRRAHALTEAARYNGQLNPGMARVSRLSAEPRVWARALDDMVAPAEHAGLLTIIRGAVPVAADVDGDEIRAITVRPHGGGPLGAVQAAAESASDRDDIVIDGRYFLDATEFGDLVELAGVESVVGAESRDQTGEMHAADREDERDQQAVSWCCALEMCPGEDHTIPRPGDYDAWRTHTLPGWPGPLFSWTDVAPDTNAPRFKSLMEFERNELGRDEFSLWIYRRMRAASVYTDPDSVREATLVNWVHIDYTDSPLVGVTRAERAAALAGARAQTRAFVHWVQTEAPRHDGGAGYPEVRLAGEALGTNDGLAREVYVREARRIRALRTITESDVGVEMRADREPGAHQFADSVGVGSYRIDLHPSPIGRLYVDVSTWPFQIPLRALIPVRMRNLLAAAKNIGTTHVTNGCYRLHPIEWNIGEAAGVAAAHALGMSSPRASGRSGQPGGEPAGGAAAASSGLRTVLPAQALAEGDHLADIQRVMAGDRGADLAWPRWARVTPRLGAEMPGQRS